MKRCDRKKVKLLLVTIAPQPQKQQNEIKQVHMPRHVLVGRQRRLERLLLSNRAKIVAKIL